MVNKGDGTSGVLLDLLIVSFIDRAFDWPIQVARIVSAAVFGASTQRLTRR
jgi:hypothetical protein